MNGTLQNTNGAPTHSAAERDTADSSWPLLRPAVLPSQPACCCPARPLYQVVIPSTATRPHPVEVLLCGHHYRRSQPTLHRIGSPIYDLTGCLVAQPV